MDANPTTETTGADKTGPSGRSQTTLAALCIAVVALVAYSNTFDVPFLYDDLPNIVENAGMKKLWPPWAPFFQKSVGGLGNRPLAHFSLAMNWVAGQGHVFGFHLVNLLFHILAGLTLFGIVRQTLVSEKMAPVYGRDAIWIAAFCSLFWVAHPVQTESVTYIIQRCENLSGLFFFLVLYFAIRGGKAGNPGPWRQAAVAAMILGALTKESMAMAPLCVLCYDWIFRGKKPLQAITGAPGLYVGLAVGWIVLALAIFIPFGTELRLTYAPHTWWEFVSTQPRVIAHYLFLCLWPDNLCLDYGWPVSRAWETGLFGALLLGALAGTVVLVIKRRPAGYPAAWFFLTLAPSSGIVCLFIMASEHRLYLPLAAVCTLITLGAYRGALWLDQGRENGSSQDKAMARTIAVGLGVLLVLVLGALTHFRNQAYESPIAIWADTVSKQPENSRANMNHGLALINSGRLRTGISRLKKAVRLEPEYARAHFNLADAYHRMGKKPEAVFHYKESIRLAPWFLTAHQNLGDLQVSLGQTREAYKMYMRALKRDPEFFPALCGVGNLHLRAGQIDKARGFFNKAQDLAPESPLVHNCMGQLLLRSGQPELAAHYFDRVVEALPASASAHVDLGNALALIRRTDEAIKHYEKALELAPAFAMAYNQMGVLLLQTNQHKKALEPLQQAVLLSPDYFDAHVSMGSALLLDGQKPRAIRHFEHAVGLSPDNIHAHMALGNALLLDDQADKAILHLEKATDLAPDNFEARVRLGSALFHLGRKEKALFHYEQAKRIWPDHPEITQALEKLKLKLNEKDK